MAGKNHYTLKVRSGFENIVARHLQKHGIEVIIPERQNGQGRAYVICRSGETKPQLMANVPGVLCIVSDPIAVK